MEDRAEKVLEILSGIFNGDHEHEQNGFMKVMFCYYHSKSQHHIDAHRNEFGVLRSQPVLTKDQWYKITKILKIEEDNDNVEDPVVRHKGGCKIYAIC